MSRTCAATADAGATGAEPGDQNGGAPDDDASGGMGGAAGARTDSPNAGAAGHDESSAGAGAGAGAGGDGPSANLAPTVLDVSPARDAVDANPDGKVVLTFSEPLDPATVTAKNIKLLNSDTEVAGELTYSGETVTFTPSVPLYLLESYEVSVSTAVTDAQGAPLVKAYSSAFTTRDGAWKTIDAETGMMTELAESVPLSATGNALLAWTPTSSGGCPTIARWFRLGAANGAAQPFASITGAPCAGVASGGNSAGLAAVAWQTPHASGGEVAQQFRNGAWQANNAVVTSDAALAWTRVAVSPTGMVTIIAHKAGGNTTAWRTDQTGKWAAGGDLLAAHKATSAASIAFDAAGNGLAVWSATPSAGRTEILCSKYTIASGKWSVATAIPDSMASNVNVGATDYAPTVIMTPDGDGMAAWMQAQTDVGGLLNTSVYSRVSGWAAEPYSISGTVNYPSNDAPGLAFDGEAFVAAWVTKPIDPVAGVCGAAYCTYTNRYDRKDARWGIASTSQTVAADVAVQRMPRVVSDGRGRAMMVWAKDAGGGSYALVYQRYVGAVWGAISAVPGGTLTNNSFGLYPFPGLSMNASGMAVLAWANYGVGSVITGRLASFY